MVLLLISLSKLFCVDKAEIETLIQIATPLVDFFWLITYLIESDAIFRRITDNL